MVWILEWLYVKELKRNPEAEVQTYNLLRLNCAWYFSFAGQVGANLYYTWPCPRLACRHGSLSVARHRDYFWVSYRSISIISVGVRFVLLSTARLQKFADLTLWNINFLHNINITTVLPVLYGSETWSLTLREEHRLRVFEKRVRRRIFGPKGGRILWKRQRTYGFHKRQVISWPTERQLVPKEGLCIVNLVNVSYLACVALSF
jgi:hypothetical protein